MGTLFSALDIGQSGMQVAQAQLDVAGHNIANVNKPGYARQRAMLASRPTNPRPYGILGRGVQITDVEQVRDAFLDMVYRQQVPTLGSTDAQLQYYSLIQDAFLEPSENGFGARINTFFDSLNDFSNNVEESPVRQAVLSEAQAVASSFNDMGERLFLLRTQANEEVRNSVPQLNSMARRITMLNDQIRAAEQQGQSANDLRDERGVALDELARLVNITYRERDDGQVDVLIGGSTLVNGNTTREVAAFRNPALDPARDDLVELRFVDNDEVVNVSDGEIYGALYVRDTTLQKVAGQVDTMAATMIQQINRIHSQGNGLTNLSGTIRSSNPVNAATDPLVSAGLPFSLTPGTFDVVVYDASGTPSTTTITITNATTLNDLATALSAVPNFAASVVNGNTLELGTSGAYTFSFANDTSGALAALGINGLFTGTDAVSIAVNQDILDDPNLLTSGYSLDPLVTGDNRAALAMAGVRNGSFFDGNTATLNDYYQSTVAQVGVDAQANTQALNVQEAFVQTFERRRQEVSGVSLDEEVTGLLTFQRAYEASARVITVADRMLDALLGMAR